MMTSLSTSGLPSNGELEFYFDTFGGTPNASLHFVPVVPRLALTMIFDDEASLLISRKVIPFISKECKVPDRLLLPILLYASVDKESKPFSHVKDMLLTRLSSSSQEIVRHLVLPSEKLNLRPFFF
jgi:hypothetical protein